VLFAERDELAVGGDLSPRDLRVAEEQVAVDERGELVTSARRTLSGTMSGAA
jgi:hypothetical protein